MAYRVEYTEVASAEVDQAFFYILQHSPEGDAKWFEGLVAALANLAASLEVLPGRRALAPENHLFPDVDVYQFIYGRGASAYRILYRLIESVEDESVYSLRVIHVVHGARKHLTPGIPSDTDENPDT